MTLTESEKAFFADAQPLGFILFARNIAEPDQVRALIASLREAVGRADAPVLLDQEGGRVARLRPPHWRALPPAAQVAELGDAAAKEASWLVGRLIASDMRPLGFDVCCAPVLDVLATGVATDVIGDRSFGSDPSKVVELGRAMADGLQAGGILPVIKHLPGHGRAHVDSHYALPVVDAPAAELEATDFIPFRALSDLPIGMTAHIVYSAYDAEQPATCSRIVVGDVIRGIIGFDGFLLSDDVCMAALPGSMAARTAAALSAGCDAVLHCNGRLAEMRDVAAAAPPMADAARRRWGPVAGPAAEPFDANEGMTRLTRLLPLA